MQITTSSRSKWLEQITTSYVLLVAAWLGLRLIWFDRLWWMALLNTFALALFLPLAVLLPLALWRQRWQLLVALALPTALFFADVLYVDNPAVAVRDCRPKHWE